MSDDPEKVTPRRGRPKSENPLTPVTVWISPSEYDRLDQLAKKQETELSPFARRILVSRLP